MIIELSEFYFRAWKIPEKDPFYVFRQTVLKFSQAIKDLNFDEKEIMLISALTLFSTGKSYSAMITYS